MVVRELMHKNIETITSESAVVEAAKRMKEGDFGVIPVVDGDKIVGMLTDRDIAMRGVAESKDLSKVQVSEIMTPDVLSCSEDDDLEKVEKLMSERQVRRIVVIGKNKKLVGILSVADIARQSQWAQGVGSTMTNTSEAEQREPTQH